VVSDISVEISGVVADDRAVAEMAGTIACAPTATKRRQKYAKSLGSLSLS
jgi:hypothetical protein